MAKVEENFCQLSQLQFDHLNSKDIKFQDKIFAMTNMLELTEDDKCMRNRIAAEIERFLRPFYPQCTVLIFGSSMNGFGFRGCDLDLLFLPYPEYCNLDFEGKETQEAPKPYKILNGKVSAESLLSLNDRGHLKFVQRVMFSKRYYFSNATFIPAKCPILNIEFTEYPMSCDFSASNQLVVHNTELLWNYGNLDYRVKPLVIVLRYWAKALGFIAKNRLSSYAFTLMVIFFLQNTVPPILPSIQHLNEIAGFSRIIDGWETALSLDTSRNVKYDNFTTVDELLVQFFEFYVNFDWIQNVVSPYYGRPLHVNELKESKDERIKKFPVNLFSIQDAFILSRNVSRNASMKSEFQNALLIAKDFVVKQDIVFQSLFNSSLYKIAMDNMYRSVSVANNDTFSDSVSFTVCLNQKICSKLGITSQLSPWYEKACQAVFDVLQYGLLIDCEILDKSIWSKEDSSEPPAKKKKLDVSALNLELIMSIQCKFSFWTLLNRQKFLVTELDAEIGAQDLPRSLKKQFQISKWLFQNGDLSLPVVWFMCQVYKHSNPTISDVIVSFMPLVDDPVFKDRQTQLKNFVKKYVNACVNED